MRLVCTANQWNSSLGLGFKTVEYVYIYVDVGRVCLLMIMYTYIVITHMMLHMMYVYHCYVSCQAQANFAQKHGSTREAVNQ